MSNFLAWAGGKSQVLKHISPHIPKYIRNYYEPFLGGGSVLLHLLDQIDKGAITLDGAILCADINKALILTFETVKTCTERVIQQYEDMCEVFHDCVEEELCKKHYSGCVCRECFYHSVRTSYNCFCQKHLQGAKKMDVADLGKMHVTTRIQIAAQFLFLNATCYRGLYRESKSGLMNSCFWTKRPIKPKSQQIRDAGQLFRKFDVRFVACGYDTFLKDYITQPASRTDFMLLDPPYIPQGPGDNISEVYHRDGFGDNDTEAVIEWINDHVDTMNITYCNHATEEILAMCMDVWPVIKTYDVRRCLKYSGTADVACELLISNVGAEEEGFKT